MSSHPHAAAAPAARIASRTGQAAVSNKTPAGIWIDKIKTNLVMATQPDQDEMLTHMMDHMNNGADLNTPEIKLEDFNFGPSGSVHHGDDHGQQANSPDSALDQGHFYEESAAVSQDLPRNNAFVDMGLGGYDLIASDFEDRVSLTNDGQPCTVTSSTPSQPNAPMLSSYPTNGNSLSAGPWYPTSCNAATVPSMNQQQFSFTTPEQDQPLIPNEVSTMMDELFKGMDLGPLLDDGAVTEKDMSIYEQSQDSPLHPDLVSNALQQAQLDPSTIIQLDDASDSHVTVTNTLDEMCLLTEISDDSWLNPDQSSDNTQIDLDNLDGVLATPGSIIHTPCFITNTSTIPTIPVVQKTPTTATSLPVVATPAKGRVPIKVVLMTPTGGEAVRDRPKRNSKKPLRFDEMVMDMEGEQPVASVSHHPVTTFTSVSMSGMKVEAGTPMVCEGVRERPKRISKKPLRLEEMVEDMELENPAASTSHTVTTRAPRVSMANLSEKEKYHRIRELNNIASRKSREKKKGKVKDLALEERVELARKEELTKKYESLKKQKDLIQELVFKIIANNRAKK